MYVGVVIWFEELNVWIVFGAIVSLSFLEKIIYIELKILFC